MGTPPMMSSRSPLGHVIPFRDDTGALLRQGYAEHGEVFFDADDVRIEDGVDLVRDEVCRCVTLPPRHTTTREVEDICLVLADIVMPGLNGIDMAEKILEVDPAMKMLMTTGYSDKIIELQWHNRFPLIRKPFLATDLVRKIRFILGIPNSAAGNPT